MTTSSDTPDDPKAEIAQLRQRVDELATPPAPPVLAKAADQARLYADKAADQAKQYVDKAADQAKQAAGQAREYTRQAQDALGGYVDQLSRQTRRAPITALLVACGAGYVLGRIVR